MAEVTFYDSAEDALLEIAVILARTVGKWIVFKHCDGDHYALPRGPRDKGEGVV